MRIFIAGATGTLGIPLVIETVGCGHDVTGLTRSEGKRTMLADLGARPVVADALDERLLTDAVARAQPDLVIDLLTAIPKTGPRRASDMRETNRLRYRGTANLLRASIAAHAKRIVAESMIFVYGYGDHGPGKLTEADEPDRREGPHTVHATVSALRYLEDMLTGASRKGLIEAVVLRFGILYGPEVPATKALLGMIRDRRLPVLASGDASKSWIHIDDAVSALLAACERGRPGEIYNIADDLPAGYRDFAVAAANLLGAPRPRSLPLWVMRLASSYRTVALLTRLNVSNDKAKRELGWQLRFPDYHEGLAGIARALMKRAA